MDAETKDIVEVTYFLYEKDMKTIRHDIEVDGKTASAFAIDKRFCLMDKIIQFMNEPEKVTFPETSLWLHRLVEEADYLGLGEIRQQVSHRLQPSPPTVTWPPLDGIFVVYKDFTRSEWLDGLNYIFSYCRIIKLCFNSSGTVSIVECANASTSRTVVYKMDNAEMLSFSVDLRDTTLQCYFVRWPIQNNGRHILRMINTKDTTQELVAEAIFASSEKLLTWNLPARCSVSPSLEPILWRSL
jgi:hypothetical protein